MVSSALPKRYVARLVRCPLAPLNEQKRIADKLDAVLARVDACRERLDRVPAILKRFRQAVLAAATSGKLTEEWRATISGASMQRSWTAQSTLETLLDGKPGNGSVDRRARSGMILP